MELVNCTGKQRPGHRGQPRASMSTTAWVVAGYMAAMHYGWKGPRGKEPVKVFQSRKIGDSLVQCFPNFLLNRITWSL